MRLALCIALGLVLAVPAAGAETPQAIHRGPTLVFEDVTPPPQGGCYIQFSKLCLLDGRIEAEVRFRNQYDGGTEGFGEPLRLTNQTGYFWFFEASNLEVVVKAVDGDGFNRKIWIFIGALSDIEFWVDVTNVTTGETQTYYNPPGNVYGIADTRALDVGLGQRCGGIAGFPCPGRLFCDLEPNCQLADATGTCEFVPEGCPAVFDPVCGCDGKTYGNDCERQMAQVRKARDGSCDE